MTARLDADRSTPGVQELKSWVGLVEYVGTFPDTERDGVPDAPAKYLAKAGEEPPEPSWSPVSLVSHASWVTWAAIGAAAVALLLVIFLIALVARIVRRRRRRARRGAGDQYGPQGPGRDQPRDGTDEFALAGGGNTSCKDGETLAVKASGARLRTIGEDGFVLLRRSDLAAMLGRAYDADPFRGRRRSSATCSRPGSTPSGAAGRRSRRRCTTW